MLYFMHPDNRTTFLSCNFRYELIVFDSLMVNAGSDLAATRWNATCLSSESRRFSSGYSDKRVADSQGLYHRRQL